MSIISYAQNFEDVILHRAFKDVNNGFYIDVGANDPVIDSVTKAFYDAGWRGINIEPVNEWYEKLQKDRPDDINLQVAAGMRKGNADFYEIPGTGLSTSNKSIAKQYEQEQGLEPKITKVPVVRLTTICEQHAHSDIHFIKIDVEGAEKSVLRGLNLKKFRPWVILVESTMPGTQIEKHKDWEPILLGENYEYIKFDGLNRLYVAKEHKKIKAHLMAPPNVFDGFVLSGTGSSSFHVGIAHIQTTLQTTRQKCHQLEKQAQELQAEATHLTEELHEKEARLQQADTIHTDNKQETDRLKNTLKENKTYQQKIEATLMENNQQRQQLNAQVQILEAEATYSNEKLHSKEERLQEVDAILADKKQEIDELKNILKENQEHQLKIKESLLENNQQRQKLEAQIQILEAEATTRNEKLREKEALLQNTNTVLADKNHEIGKLNSALTDNKVRCQQLENRIQILETEVTHRDEKLLEKETWLQESRAALIDNKQETDKLHNTLTESISQQPLTEETLLKSNQQLQQLNTRIQILETEATYRDDKLRGKEALLQEARSALIDNKQEMNKLHNTLTESISQQQLTEESLQKSNQQRQQLKNRIQMLETEVTRRDDKLHEKEDRLQEAKALLTDNKHEIGKLQNSLSKSSQLHQTLALQLQTLTTKVSQYNDLLHEKENHINSLSEELKASKQEVDELNLTNNQWWTLADQHSKELQLNKTIIGDLNQSSNQWWLEADQLTQELQEIYNSKFWRMTWPLRKAMQILKWVLALPVRLILWLIRLPKRFARWLLTKAITFVHNHPLLKARLKNRLKKYPGLYARSKRRAFNTNTPNSLPPSTPQDEQPKIEATEPIQPVQQEREEAAVPIQPDLKSNIIEASNRWVSGRRLDA